MSHSAKLSDPKNIRRFATAGRARITLVSERTGRRFTFQIKAKKGEDGKRSSDFFFVSVLTGANNEGDYTYLGHVNRGEFHNDRKLRIGHDAPSRQAFSWFWRRLEAEQGLPECEVWHEGRCGRCSRVLTVPESIQTGLGPVCAARHI